MLRFAYIRAILNYPSKMPSNTGVLLHWSLTEMFLLILAETQVYWKEKSDHIQVDIAWKS